MGGLFSDLLGLGLKTWSKEEDESIPAGIGPPFSLSFLFSFSGTWNSAIKRKT